MTSGTKTLLGEALSWTLIAVLTALTLSHFEEIKVFAIAAIEKAQAVKEQKAAAEFDLDDDSDSSKTDTAFGSARISRGRNGHYNVRAKINGRPIDVLVDTGATLVAMSYEDAQKAGIFVAPSDFIYRSRTANGVARSAQVTLSRVRIGDITIRNVRASIAEPGRLHVTLLGMSFLGRLSRVEINSGDLVLQK